MTLPMINSLRHSWLFISMYCLCATCVGLGRATEVGATTGSRIGSFVQGRSTENVGTTGRGVEERKRSSGEIDAGGETKIFVSISLSTLV